MLRHAIYFNQLVSLHYFIMLLIFCQDDCHTDWVSCVRFSPNTQNPVIVSCGWDKLVKVRRRGRGRGREGEGEGEREGGGGERERVMQAVVGASPTLTRSTCANPISRVD